MNDWTQTETVSRKPILTGQEARIRAIEDLLEGFGLYALIKVREGCPALREDLRNSVTLYTDAGDLYTVDSEKLIEHLEAAKRRARIHATEVATAELAMLGLTVQLETAIRNR